MLFAKRLDTLGKAFWALAIERKRYWKLQNKQSQLVTKKPLEIFKQKVQVRLFFRAEYNVVHKTLSF